MAIIILTVVLLFLIWLTAYLGSIPMIEAKKQAEMGKPIQITGSKEFRYLAESYNRMHDKLNENKVVSP